MAEPETGPDGVALFHAESRGAWREWLEANHGTARGVWLVSYKKASGRPRVTYDEAVEEALCFGWIDSRPNRLDELRFMQRFSPRKPGSPWSRLNKRRLEGLLREGRVAPAGQAAIDAARADGSWGAYDAVERLEVPADLRDALAADGAAQRHFGAFSPSVKKSILWWIESARRPQTRSSRVAETVRLAAQGLKANQYRQ